MNNSKKENLDFYHAIRTSFVLFLLLFLIHNSSYVTAQVTDSFSTKNYGLSKLVDFAYGLIGRYDSIDRKDTITNINNKSDKLLVLGVDFKSHAVSSAQTQLSSSLSQDTDSTLSPEILDMPLVYPNPFRQSIKEGAILSYVMNKDFDVEIHIYNMLSERVFKQTFLAGSIGARKGSNRLKINNESLLGYNLSAGVYFFVIINDGNVLSKGKMVVKP